MNIKGTIEFRRLYSMVIWGNGQEAERFIFQNRELLKDITCCVTTNGGGIFHGKPVRAFSDLSEDKKERIVVCATSFNVYNEIAEILKTASFVEFLDFIWSRAYGKKVVVVNANCHGSALIKYLNLSKTFNKEYFVYPLSEIHENYEGQIPEELLNNADVYIHQDIRANNKMGYKLSDEYTVCRLKDCCIDISIPNFVGMSHWMFPNLGKCKHRNNTDFFQDRILDEAVSSTDCTFENIRQFWESYDYPDEQLDSLFNNGIEKIKEREKNWDIKVSDYIIQNYKQIPLFVDCDHPSKYLMRYIGRKVAEILKISDICDDYYESGLGLTNPVLPVVRRHFCLEFECPIETKAFLGVEYDILEDDYIKNYVWWFHDLAFDSPSEH